MRTRNSTAKETEDTIIPDSVSTVPDSDKPETAAAAKRREKKEEKARKKEETARKRRETNAKKKEAAALNEAETQLDKELQDVARDSAAEKEAARMAAALLPPTTGRAAKGEATKKTAGIFNANKRPRKAVGSEGEQAPPAKRHASNRTSKNDDGNGQSAAPVGPVKPVKPGKKGKEKKESDDENDEGDDEHSEDDEESEAEENLAGLKEQKKLREQLEDAEPQAVGKSDVINTTIAPRTYSRRVKESTPSSSDLSEGDLEALQAQVNARVNAAAPIDQRKVKAGEEASATPSRSKKASSTPMDVDKQPETGADLSEEDRVRAWRLLWFYSERNRSKVSSPMDFEVDEGPAPGTAFLGEDYALAMKLLKGYKWNDVMFY
ncbi:hypothetical protein PENSPDRAFT_672357, partial [Peniophora sp. CONT]